MIRSEWDSLSDKEKNWWGEPADKFLICIYGHWWGARGSGSAIIYIILKVMNLLIKKLWLCQQWSYLSHANMTNI